MYHTSVLWDIEGKYWISVGVVWKGSQQGGAGSHQAEYEYQDSLMSSATEWEGYLDDTASFKVV